ncbi:arginase family protein [Myroides odoratimimus]|uniref:arginase family protein n=1 Tax=Myroides odoratimimus TaxID=76832 RepID=UPI0025781134|nr:arginase family protein [Myroides odoratimimus]MDM1398273.1 arginase family protein [Myroides odoratimimus]
MKRKVIIECPTNLGLAQSTYAKEPGVRFLPTWLEKYRLYSIINPDKIYRIEAPAYSMNLDENTQVRNADEIIEYATKQADIVEEELSKNSFLIVLGGDCSILIGSALALKRKGRYGLFFLDGHTDYVLPGQLGVHGAAGMDLAIVCGAGHERLTNIQNNKPYIEEEYVFCVGNREYNEEYERPIKESKVVYYPLSKLRNYGIKRVVSDFLMRVEEYDLEGYFIHLDVDVLNDKIMPAVDCRQEDGLNYKELKEILIPLVKDKRCVGLEIAILDPDLDPLGVYTNEFIENVRDIIETSL